MQDEDRFCSNCGSQAVGYEENTKGTEEELVHSSKLTGSSLKSKVIICVLAIIVLTGVFAIWPKSIEHGNTAGNLNNYGVISEKDGWIYYSNSSDEGKLYKMRTDGTERTKLNDHNSCCINIAGDWIYYLNSREDYQLYKMRTDGTERQIVD